MARRSDPSSRSHPRRPVPWRRAALVLCALALTGCAAVEAADRNLRRIDVLDRVFDPGRFREPPPSPPAAPVVQAEAVTALPDETGSETSPQPASTEPPETVARSPEPVASEQEVRQAPPDPAVRRAALLRQYPWLSRFWGELDTTQQGRVSRALRRAGSPAPEDSERWDRMGLADRVRLVFGGA